MLGVDAGQREFRPSLHGARAAADRARRPRYARTLLTRGKVTRRASTRGATDIRAQVEQLAAGSSGRAIIADALLDEVTALVEWPVALAGQFEARFLSLPREVLISTLQEHQRYFAVEDAAGALLPWFITISNIDSPIPDVVRAGNERVVRPRLADAAFFWEQDRRQPLAARRARPRRRHLPGAARLAGRAHRAHRGAGRARSPRSIGADGGATARAAQLAKCDLLTAMVGEFPELQGIMGRYYALADGEAPRGRGGDPRALPAARRRRCAAGLGASAMRVALADKLDTLAGIFAIGQKPSGTRDPFGLRRAAIGVLRIVLEHRLELDLRRADRSRRATAAAAPTSRPRRRRVAAEIYDFVLERLRAQYLERAAENGISTEMFDAVLATRPRSLLDFDARLRALVGFVAQPGRRKPRRRQQAHRQYPAQIRACAASAAARGRIELLREAAERALHARCRRCAARCMAGSAGARLRAGARPAGDIAARGRCVLRSRAGQ